MLTDVVQRWRGGRASYRPAGETINTREYEIAKIAKDRIARDWCGERHYTRTLPPTRERFGLYRRGELVGLAVYSVSMSQAALNSLPGEGDERIELGRFVLDDDCPANSESYFLAQTFNELRRDGYTGVLSFSDPVPRSNAAGDIIFPGHVGTIYQATGSVYAGRATARVLRLLPDGTVLSPRALQKARSGERGHKYVTDMLVRNGADPLRDGEDRAEWVHRTLAKITRPLRHQGNHRYLWALNPRDRKHLPESLPYPKIHTIGGGLFPIGVTA